MSALLGEYSSGVLNGELGSGRQLRGKQPVGPEKRGADMESCCVLFQGSNQAMRQKR